MRKVALVGNGYLGQAYEQVFPEALVYDEPKELYAGEESVEAGRVAVNSCDIAIVAVPTDYTDDGELDTSIVEDVVNWLDTETILIKSALQPGTVDRLVEETGKNIAVSAEFIGEGKYYQPPHKYPHPQDPRQHQLLIVGGEEPARSIAAETLWSRMSPDIRIHLVTALEAEITKMAENTYGALKVTWANVLRDICDQYGANFIQVHQAWSEDGRVDPMHTRSVSDNRGWNSKCYNKDVPAFANISGSEMLKGLLADNARHLAMNTTQEEVGKRDDTL
jgi:UDPglucose 6-dehydrogenase